MALANPLLQASFADVIRVQDVQFVQGWQQQSSITGGGEARYADRAPSLWQAELTTIPMLNADAVGIMALINTRAGGLKTLLLHDYRLPYPSSDPDGSIIGDTVPTINAIVDRLHLSFSGFPPGYVIPFGTYFGVVFDMTRYYLGQFAETRTANPITGAVAAVEVWPPLPASVIAGAAVTVKKPPAKFRIDPGSAYPSSEGGLHATIKLSAKQTYSA
ncbi:hypothetical protein GCM10011321_14580 [Youhaiella tibetensis]|uniref:Uncharacterized protein n=1 Tax=Paradevosia tibetensis TaxID=1447062 RepID=A0A5B9DN53_9HYPH|nr:hypothetical protein [Youhaiella tibetensis]QEE20422.1 hypothetical protein FNA67_09660 [Youhaiella tibetensis]GGF24291.1 hypothetical protein GCM10011321_14580 [Youhaiella tibetensis]